MSIVNQNQPMPNNAGINTNNIVYDNNGKILYINLTNITDRKFICYQGNIYKNGTYYEKPITLASIIEQAIKCKLPRQHATHLGKYSHPNSTINAYVKHGTNINAGYICSESVNVTNHYVFTDGGKGAKTNQLLFDTVTIDGVSIYDGFKADNPILQKEIISASYNYQDIKKALFLEKPQNNIVFSKNADNKYEDINTIKDSKNSKWGLRQVYFPISFNDEDGTAEYHLLSILQDSNLLYEMRKRIDKLKYTHKFYDLTSVKYGGTNAQNLGYLNSSCSGVFYLLPALPPTIDQNYIKPIKDDFFVNCLNAYQYNDSFKHINQIQKLYTGSYNIKKIIFNIIDRIIYQACQLQEQEPGWSDNISLKPVQKIWLDNKYRTNDITWKEDIAYSIMSWINRQYRKQYNESLNIDVDALCNNIKHKL